MKNYKEMADSVFQRSEEIIAKRNQKKKAMYKAASFASCVCLAALLGVGVFQRGMFTAHKLPNGGDTIQPGSSAGGFDVQNTSGEQENLSQASQSEKVTRLAVNDLGAQLITADMDVQYSFYSKLSEEALQTVKEEFHTRTGIEYDNFIMRLPAEINSFYSLSARGYEDTDLEGEYKLHDYVFDCQTEDGGQAIIAICAFEKPLRDCIFECDNPEMSEVNGIPLVIYECERIYMVQFSFQGVNYDIETRNMNLEGLESLLTSLLAD